MWIATTWRQVLFFKQLGSSWRPSVWPEYKYMMRIVETYMRTDELRQRREDKRQQKRRKDKSLPLFSLSLSVSLVSHHFPHDNDGEAKAQLDEVMPPSILSSQPSFNLRIFFPSLYFICYVFVFSLNPSICWSSLTDQFFALAFIALLCSFVFLHFFSFSFFLVFCHKMAFLFSSILFSFHPSQRTSCSCKKEKNKWWECIIESF